MTSRIRAVTALRARSDWSPSRRDCPSGALSYALSGREQREHVDWGNGREPAIEVTKDGPYRVTGGVPLVDADGTPVRPAAGASAEHCAICRCGH